MPNRPALNDAAAEKEATRQTKRQDVLARLAKLLHTDVPTLLDAIHAPDPEARIAQLDDGGVKHL